MSTKNTLKFIAIAAMNTMFSTVFAHDGHGLPGAHWHATDVLGFVALGAVVAVASWLSRGDK